MNIIGLLYNTIIYRPLLNALIFLYNTVAFQDLGLAIIILTILVRLALFPLFQKNLYHTMKMQELQPKLKKIQEEHKGNKEKEVEATMALFKEHGTSPFILFGLTFAQFPILIGLYQIFAQGLKGNFAGQLYSFIHVPAAIHATLFGLINLAEVNTILVGLVAIAQYLQARVAIPPPADPKNPTKQERMAKWNAFIAPAVIVFLLLKLNIPAAVGLYWMIAALFSTGQQLYIRNQAHG